ncbi:hypothetical protein CAEBREN_28293 [Caenorhabditis brenneri]|uniref:Uncharacterized protein n=1 Tax=Caenorhabditis brenneri TaxID=135651 RepID=G0ND74_CAEBE|nr:hypothetical protein CAEBREN_28293 [Caenorhabditis brenneri]
MKFIVNQVEMSDTFTNRFDDGDEPQPKKIISTKRRRQVGDDAGSEKSARSRYMMSSTMKILICLMKTWRYVEREKKSVILADDSDEKGQTRRIDDDDDMISERGSNHGNNSRVRGGCDGYGSDFQRNSDDFIEDDGDSLRRRRERYRGDDNIPESAEKDARDIFGVEDSNFDEIYDDDGAKIEFEGVKEEIICRRRWRRSVNKRPHKKTTLLGFIEPSELVRGFLSATDKEIMIEDAPERFKLRKTPVTKSNEDEIDREAYGTRL